MRAKIIQYNSNDGSGLVSGDGRQFEFTIRQWTGDVAPTVNRVVEVELSGDEIVAVSAVPEDVLLKEKANALKEKLGGASSKLLNSNEGNIGKNILAQAGVPLIATYVVFFLASLMFNFGFARTFGMGSGISLYDLAGLFAQAGKGSYRLMLFGAYLSFLVPVFWKHRFAPLATVLPVIVLMSMSWEIYSQYANANEAYFNQMGVLWGRVTRPLYPSFTDFFNFSLGFYAGMATALYAAWLGVRKSLIS